MRTVRVPPAVWFDRLAKAIERGAIDRMAAGTIAERILTTPDPGGATEAARVA